MKVRLRTQLTVSFVATALICVVLIGVLSNLQLEKHFKEYVRQNQEKKNREIIGLITAKAARDGAWDRQAIEDIGLYAMEQGLMLDVRDAQGNTVWSAEDCSPGNCEAMMQSMSRNMGGRPGELTQEQYPVQRNGAAMGTIWLRYYGPVYYDDLDLHFIQTLNHIFIGVGLFSLALAITLGVLLSRRISGPVTRVIRTTQSIAQGTYTDRVHPDTGVVEISQLTDSVNNLAQSLEQQEALRRRLTGDVAHELRTPLATVQSHLEAMIDGIWEPTAERLNGCHDEITRLARLVSDLERLAFYEAESLMIQKSPVVLQEFAQQLVDGFEAEAIRKGVRLCVLCGDTVLSADRDKLSQVLVNLLSNALRFTGEGGTITIGAEEEPGLVRLTVSDTGAGIAAEHLPHIFERFYRADVSRNRLTGGSGIGLALVKAITEAHGGQVSAISVEGQGATFNLIFPTT